MTIVLADTWWTESKTLLPFHYFTAQGYRPGITGERGVAALRLSVFSRVLKRFCASLDITFPKGLVWRT
ncbi:hypothetical protein [Breoghania sp.]|uniref:hypothetical protein n=1 Tax=Breoghania sp. TaxID=2065378 RepID=UPI00261E6D0E|nr:hypothetical protein [Breoghania sp.]MDJ0933146.1 hypothetical protein [Breoghania sp.]